MKAELGLGLPVAICSFTEVAYLSRAEPIYFPAITLMRIKTKLGSIYRIYFSINLWGYHRIQSQGVQN